MKKLNVGCGRDYKEGWENWDKSHAVKTERCFDIRRQPWPCTDGDAQQIYISGVLEQIGSNEELVHVMNQAHRCLQPNGKMTVVVPNAKYAIAHRDPMDVRKFTPATFSYFLKTAKEFTLYGSVYGFLGWSDIRIEENARHILTVTMIK